MVESESGSNVSMRFILNWRSGESCQFSLGAIDAAISKIADVGSLVESIQTDCENLAEAIRVLAPLTTSEMDWLNLDGHSVQVARDTQGGKGFIPGVGELGVECLERTTTVWDSGAATKLNQQESIYRYEDLYWVEATGDYLNRTVIAGWYAVMNEGLAAASQASEYFEIESLGKVRGLLGD